MVYARKKVCLILESDEILAAWKKKKKKKKKKEGRKEGRKCSEKRNSRKKLGHEKEKEMF